MKDPNSHGGTEVETNGKREGDVSESEAHFVEGGQPLKPIKQGPNKNDDEAED